MLLVYYNSICIVECNDFESNIHWHMLFFLTMYCILKASEFDIYTKTIYLDQVIYGWVDNYF